MIERVIRWSIHNRLLVILATALLTIIGWQALRQTPVDALPDLSDVQVIVRTTWPGQAPQIVEDQITYPLSATLLSVPAARTVRGYSFFGESYVYVLFDDRTDLYWARSRVLEYLNQVQSRLPGGAVTALGPDATGVGWIYEYALRDTSGKHDLSELRAVQDWFLRYELKSVAGVAEVASVGGMVRQYQIIVDPDRLRARGLSHSRIIDAVQRANGEAGGSVLELAEAEYMVRASGYLRTLDDLRAIPLAADSRGVPVQLGDVARVQWGPAMRRGIAELNGEGEVAGGIIVMRSGENARQTIAAVKTRLAELRASLPPGIEIVETYDRSDLIDRAIDHLRGKLIEEFLVVALACALFLFHVRSAIVAIVALPLGVLAAFGIMRLQGINANIMSLGGIAIAIGAMVDAAVVMIENAHKRLEAWHHAHPGRTPAPAERWQLVADAASQVGPALFFSLLIITLSFVPVFALQAQEGRLFAPLAYTKTYAMAAAAAISITIVPVLMGYWIRGRIPEESANPVNRLLVAMYRPALQAVMAHPRLTVVSALVILAATLIPLQRLGSEFLPPLDEGDLLYMPTALPGLSAGKAAQVLQQTDRMIRSVPEVASVFGKIGKADTATDTAPMEMIETTVRLKPRAQWRPGMTPERVVAELDTAVQMPGLTNLWVQPIRNRLDMLATGIKSPIGIKVNGNDLAQIDQVAKAIEAAVKTVPGVHSVLAERLTGGRYVDIDIDRAAAARRGLNIADVQSVVRSLIGGEDIGESIDGRRRFPISLRYPREWRDSVQKLRELPIITDAGLWLTLADVARVSLADGPPMIRSENGRLTGWIYVDASGRDLAALVHALQRRIQETVTLPPGYSISWSGQFEYLERAAARLRVVVPAAIACIFLLLFLTFRRIDDALLILLSLPLALVGGLWLIFLLDHSVSVASVIGFIALAGVSAEFGVLMLLYLKQAWERRLAAGEPANAHTLDGAIYEGALQRVRPKAMTVTVILAGLMPILFGDGTGAQIMQRIAAPMVGGMVTAPVLSMLVTPVLFRWLRRRELARDSLHTQPHGREVDSTKPRTEDIGGE
ncbi:efflux RND transporter permease subunit [Tahibacter amnicola]|uniref:Efflux RND transporter permease subunit n=1 Tax=Tahibacter amnicola TaxID=2976241 RepID=A0ABY6B9V4_9GAMM|nr:efflux RND transporter permease subunit [Tahibacter amnicola]UXI66316.1 efflux RND transporter permease subunit [Tahibacter amnicola]